MAGQTFISHASTDADTAAAVCAALERRGLACWMAPRDMPAGGEYAQAIVSAIKASGALVVLFSPAANDSPHVLREIERAVTLRIPILPLRLGGAQPSGSMEYLLATPHWLDAPANPGETSFDALAAALRRAPSAPGRARTLRPLGIMAATVLQCVVALLDLFVGVSLLSVMALAAQDHGEDALRLLPHGAGAVVFAAGLFAGAAGLLFRQKWAHRTSVLLNLVNVPFQLVWASAAASLAHGGPAPNSTPLQLFAMLVSLTLVVYLFQGKVNHYFSTAAS